MTVTFTQEATSASFGTFLKLLFRWRGSIYKLLWKDLCLFLILYYLVRFLYRDLLNADGKRTFEDISVYAQSLTVSIPLSLVLAFYMQFIFIRWQNYFNSITWPDRMALVATANIKGLDDRGRLIRRTLMRYLMVGYIMNLRSICPSVKRRFPTLGHLTQAGLLTAQEEQIIEGIPKNKVNKYFIPFIWAVNVIGLARREGRIYDDYAVYILNQELTIYRTGLGRLLRYDAVSFPLVSTQTVTLAVHMFVLFSVFGRQFLEQKKDGSGDTDLFVNVVALLQFFLYVGWLKLAEMMINPFGDDDDDFDMNLLIDRNLQYCYLVVDDLHADLPPLAKDKYWDEEPSFIMPYTVAAAKKFRGINVDIGSANAVRVSETKSNFIAPPMAPSALSKSMVRSTIHTAADTLFTEELEDSFPEATPAMPPKGKQKLSGALRRSAETVLNPKKILESVEQQFKIADATTSAQPFDNRFEEIDYLEGDQDIDDDNDADIEEEVVAIGSSIWKTSANLAYGAYSGLKRIVSFGRFGNPPGDKETKEGSPAKSPAPPAPSPDPDPFRFLYDEEEDYPEA